VKNFNIHRVVYGPVLADQVLTPTRGEPDVHEGFPGRRRGFNSGTVAQRLLAYASAGQRCSNLDTLLGRGRPRGAHAVEFSKTAALSRKVLPSAWVRPGIRGGSRGGPTIIARGARHGKKAGKPFRCAAGAPCATLTMVAGRSAVASRPLRDAERVRCGDAAPQPPYDRICTVTTRWRGRSSKSSRTICCQVPRANCPSTTGIVSEGPMIAARRCAWAFVSWFRRLCS
jgi:hypothetical protein